MTSLALLLGVAPLVSASEAGAKIRLSLHTAVFTGMLLVTGLGLIFTPAFYTLMQRIGSTRRSDSVNRRENAGVETSRPQAGN